MNLSRVLTAIALCWPFVSQAGPRDGGGATGAVCLNPAAVTEILKVNGTSRNTDPLIIPNAVIKDIQSVTVLDMVEVLRLKGSNGAGRELMEINTNETELQFTERVIERFKESLPLLYEGLSKAKSELSFDELSEDSDGISPIADVASVSLIDTVRCVYATIAYQEGAPGNYNRIHVDQRIFNLPNDKFSKMNRAVTFLHEVVYKYLRSNYDIKDSRTARIFVSKFLQKDMRLKEIKRIFSLANLDYDHLSIGRYQNFEFKGHVPLRDFKIYPIKILHGLEFGLNVLVNQFFSEAYEKVKGSGLDTRFKMEFTNTLLSLLNGRKIDDLSLGQKQKLLALSLERTKSIFNLETAKLLETEYLTKWQKKMVSFPGLNSMAQERLLSIFRDFSKVETDVDIRSDINQRLTEFDASEYLTDKNLQKLIFYTSQRVNLPIESVAEFNKISDEIKIPAN